MESVYALNSLARSSDFVTCFWNLAYTLHERFSLCLYLSSSYVAYRLQIHLTSVSEMLNKPSTQMRLAVNIYVRATYSNACVRLTQPARVQRARACVPD